MMQERTILKILLQAPQTLRPAAQPCAACSFIKIVQWLITTEGDVLSDLKLKTIIRNVNINKLEFK